MAATLMLSVAMGLSRTVLLVQAIAMIGAATFILTRPDRPQPRD